MGADLNLYDSTGQALRPGLAANPNDLSLLVSPSAGKYAAASQRGKSWNLSMAGAGATLAAGNVIGSTTPLVGIWNPPAQKVRASVIRAVIWTLSGTPAGPLLWGYARNPAISATGDGKAVNNDSFAIANPEGIQTYVNLAATGLSSVLLRAIGGLTSAAVGSTIAGYTEETAGSLTVEPGNFLGIFATAVGTSHIAGAAIEIEIASV